MAYRRTYRKKRTMRKRRTYRTTRTRRYQGQLIKRTCALSANVSAGVAPDNIIWNQSSRAQGYFNFSLSDLPNNGEITAMYNQYKITGVSLRLVPIVGTDATAGATTFLDSFAYQIDRSLRAVPLNMDEILESGNCRLASACQRPLKIWVPFPKAAATIAGSSAMMTTPWLDSDANFIKHYGLRYSFGQSLASAAVRFQVYATYYIRVKGLK